MSWIPTRPRALAITTLTAALLLTALPADAVVAVSSSQLTSEPGPAAAGAPILVDADTAPAATAAELTVAELITAELSAAAPTAAARIQATSIASAMGAEAPHAGARAGTGGHATKSNSSTQSARVSASSVVIAFARSHLRARYRSSATGPTSFDCSGLMWRVFKEAGLSAKVVSQNARSIYQSYRARGLASRQHPQVGDLVVWGGGSHIGVYIGGGNAISALTNGVRVHRVRAMLTRSPPTFTPTWPAWPSPPGSSRSRPTCARFVMRPGRSSSGPRHQAGAPASARSARARGSSCSPGEMTAPVACGSGP